MRFLTKAATDRPPAHGSARPCRRHGSVLL